jgi:hypothetical protein
MRTATMIDHCPVWCALDHSAEPGKTAFYHATRAGSMPLSRPQRPALPERVDVETTQYVPDEPGEPGWAPTVEVALHAGGRYRLIGLTPSEARQLAEMLTQAATAASIGGG